MEVTYYIKQPSEKLYLSSKGKWEEYWYKEDFNSEEEALLFAYQHLKSSQDFVIVKIYTKK